jgi:hypothetical protein
MHQSDASCILLRRRSLESGLIYCDPSRELNFSRPTPSALLTLGLRSSTDIPALKELEEWFDSQKEIREIAKLDTFFERTSKLTSRRLKREIERRRTLGEFALKPDPLHLKRIPSKESGSDLFRSDGPDAVRGSREVESPQISPSVWPSCMPCGGLTIAGSLASRTL